VRLERRAAGARRGRSSAQRVGVALQRGERERLGPAAGGGPQLRGRAQLPARRRSAEPGGGGLRQRSAMRPISEAVAGGQDWLL